MKIKKIIFSFIFLSLVVSAAIAREMPVYSELRITVPNRETFTQLAREGLIFDHVRILSKTEQGIVFKTVLNEREVEILKKSGVPFTTLVSDVVKAYRLRQQNRVYSVQASDVPGGFELGSMGGFYTYEEITSELDSMRQKHPDLITAKTSIGQSIEERDLWMVKISANPDVDEDESEVLYTALHHAREPAGMMSLMYFMDYLLEKYGTDPEVTYLLDHRELYFVPVVNPDGYVYNEQNNPDGGGQWRKNRRPVQNWYGVDLNRNYGYMWGYDDLGSSPYPFSDTYRGSAPFSEPETQAIRDFVNSRSIVMALNYHTYSNLLIYPWAYINALTPDSLPYMGFADDLTQQNRYNFGNGNETVNYNANGESDDWMYGEKHIFAMTPEVGGDGDGFWPDANRIVPLCKENLQPNLQLAWFAGDFVKGQNFRIVNDGNGNMTPNPGETVTVVCSAKNRGLAQASNVRLSLNTDSPYLQVTSSTGTVHALIAPDSAVADTFTVQVAADAPQGLLTYLILNIEQGGFTNPDTLYGFVIGTPLTVFEDHAENGLANWQTEGNWNIVTDQLETANHCFTDSPNGKYPDNVDTRLVLRQSLALPSSDVIYLTYRTHWDVERPFDFATVEISTDSTNWETLNAQRMVSASGSGKQTSGTTGYDGFEGEWQTEWADITSYQSAPQVYLRFRLRSDAGTRKDGWYLDDIRVLAYNTQPSFVQTATALTPGTLQLLPNYPNPFNEQTVVSFKIPERRLVDISVFDLQGRKVSKIAHRVFAAGLHKLNFNAHNLSSGIYLLSIKTGNIQRTRKMLLIK